MSQANGHATIDELLKATELPRRTRDVFLPVSRLTVEIRELSEHERTELETETYSKDGRSQIRQRMADVGLRLIQRCLVSPKIERHHIDKLKAFNCTDMNVLKDACQELCGFTQADIASLEGNSDTATGSGSASE